MAVTISYIEGDYVDWIFLARDGSVHEIEGPYVFPYPKAGAVSSEYMNKCVDTITGAWVYWSTDYQDIYGAEYPGNGFSSATYKVQSIVFGREQL